MALGSLVVSAPAAELTGSYQGHALGVSGNSRIGIVSAGIGRSAYVGCPCKGTDGKVRANTVNGLSVGRGGRILTANTTRGSTFTETRATFATVRNVAVVGALNMFDGLITAGQIRAVAAISASRRDINASADQSGFSNMQVADNSVPEDTEPGTEIPLPGIGKVTLERVTQSGSEERRRIRVAMLTILVTEVNEFHLPVGTEIVVAEAVAGFSRDPVKVVVGGQAYAALSNAAIGEQLQNRIGKAAVTNVGCTGTDGKIRRNAISDLRAGSILKIDAAETRGFSDRTASGTIARTVATASNVNLLRGLIRAHGVRAVAEDRFRAGTRTSTSDGSGVFGLEIAGVRIGDVATKNLTIPLPGIGYVIVNQQNRPDPNSAQRLKVNGLRIFVTRENAFGLTPGAEIIIAHADSTAFR